MYMILLTLSLLSLLEVRKRRGKGHNAQVKKAERVVIIGGGAAGIGTPLFILIIRVPNTANYSNDVLMFNRCCTLSVQGWFPACNYS
jgi:hypothetical protein